MKGKKLLAGVLSAAMVFGTMAFPVFADENSHVTIGDKTETYDTLLDAINATKAEDAVDSVITYNITGKVSAGNGYINFAKNVEDNTTIVFAGTDENAELALNDNDANGANIFWNDSKPITVNVKNLICSRDGGVWIGNAAQMNQYFSICANGDVTYTDCVFPDGAGAGYWKNTTFSGCTFKNDNGGETFKDTYGLWFRGVSGNKVTVKDNCVFGSPKGIKTYSDDQSAILDTEVSDTTFNCTDSPAIIASNPGTITATDINVDNCAGGVARNDKGAEITVDGKAPVYAAKVDGKLYTDKAYAKKEAAEKGKDIETLVAMVGDKYYATIDKAVEAAQAATTDKYSTAKITLLTNDALDISKGPDNYVSYNITKNDTVVTGERIAHKEYNELTNASKLYIPADVNSLILKNVKNLCSIEIAQGADVTLKLNGNNELAGNIFVPEGAKLTIEDKTADGTGRLAVYNSGAGADHSAAIGGGQAQSGGEIVIKSGEIEAYSTYGAAIGGGQQSTAKVTILGGKIKAEADFGTAIGGGQLSIGDVIIRGGVIDAKSNNSAPIGGGQQAAGDSKITISGGDITVARKPGTNLFGNSKGEPAGAKISGGTFNVDVTDYCEEGFTPKLTDGKYVVDDSATKLTLGFKKTATDERVYDIVVTAVDAAMINRLNTAELTFNLTASDADNSTVTYEILPVDKITVTPDNENTNRYMFNFNGKDGVTDTANEITVGQVRFEGYTKNGATITFKTDMAKSFVTATTKDGENKVTYFDGNGTLTADDANKIENVKFTVPTKKLTVNITFPNAIADQAAAYQDMKVVVSGSDLAENLEYALGTGENAIALENGAYKLVVDGKLTENTAYTVTVSGAGYRTARYTVNLNADKTLNFWNNVMDNAIEVEEGNTAYKKNVTFLAGDIVKDNKINIYDLSAVVSYFGTDNLVAEHPEYAKYDLNRDGVIDSKDVAYVLVSWGN